MEAVRVLGKMRTPEAKDALLRLTLGKDEEIKWAAKAELAEINDQEGKEAKPGASESDQ